MKRTQQTMAAVVTELPTLHTFFDYVTLNEYQHLAYEAEMQYVRKPNEERTILCTSLDDVIMDEPVLVSYHSGLSMYQHATHVPVSNEYNCVGGFYYTDGTPA